MTNQRQTDPGVHRHHRPAHPDAGAGDRADRAGGRGRPHAQPAQHRFGNHRDERVRHVAVAHLPPVPRPRRSWSRCWSPAISAYLAPKGLRELRDWATKVKADLVINIVQPGRFITIERGLTFHIRERRADGQLLGIFIDDRRDPEGTRHLLAEHGEIVETGRGTFLVLTTAASSGRRPGRPTRPSSSSSATRSICRASPAGRSSAHFGVRERNLWDVAFPDPDDPTYKQMPTHFRAELHDRLVAPIYPIAFTVLCFAILGAPRTSRQSREMSIVMTIVAIGALRLIGFACNVVAAQTVAAVCVQYGSIVLALRARPVRDLARRRDRAARLPDAAARHAVRAHLAAPGSRREPARDGLTHPHPLFRHALPRRRDVGVLRHLRADRAGRLHRADAARGRRAEPVAPGWSRRPRSSACRS